jgi:hypothetical protein
MTKNKQYFNIGVTGSRDSSVGDCYGLEGQGSIPVEVEVTLRLTVSKSVCFGIEDHCGTCDQIQCVQSSGKHGGSIERMELFR